MDRSGGNKPREVRGVDVAKRVKVYSTPTCPYCAMAKDFLKEQNIEFEDIDVGANREAAKKMVIFHKFSKGLTPHMPVF